MTMGLELDRGRLVLSFDNVHLDAVDADEAAELLLQGMQGRMRVMSVLSRAC